MSVDYQLYLRSEGWRARRQMMLDFAERRCQFCNAHQALQVHHRTYERLGHERFADLLVLCDGCHAKHHGKTPKVTVGSGSRPRARRRGSARGRGARRVPRRVGRAARWASVRALEHVTRQRFTHPREHREDIGREAGAPGSWGDFKAREAA